MAQISFKDLDVLNFFKLDIKYKENISHLSFSCDEILVPVFGLSESGSLRFSFIFGGFDDLLVGCSLFPLDFALLKKI